MRKKTRNGKTSRNLIEVKSTEGFDPRWLIPNAAGAQGYPSWSTAELNSWRYRAKAGKCSPDTPTAWQGYFREERLRLVIEMCACLGKPVPWQFSGPHFIHYPSFFGACQSLMSPKWLTQTQATFQKCICGWGWLLWILSPRHTASCSWRRAPSSIQIRLPVSHAPCGEWDRISGILWLHTVTIGHFYPLTSFSASINGPRKAHQRVGSPRRIEPWACLSCPNKNIFPNPIQAVWVLVTNITTVFLH